MHKYNMSFVFSFYILRLTSWIWTNRSIKGLKFESPSKWNSYVGFNLEHCPDRWWWIDGGHFFNYTTKSGIESFINRNPGSTRAADKWQGNLSGNCKFYWLQVWDPLHSSKEGAFIWFIWHKAVAVNEWRARIVHASISKQCVICLPNMTESVKHKFWDCVQARRAWRWAMFIMHKLCGVKPGNYDCFNWKQVIFRERIPKKYGKNIKIWHLLRGINLVDHLDWMQWQGLQPWTMAWI